MAWGPTITVVHVHDFDYEKVEKLTDSIAQKFEKLGEKLSDSVALFCGGIVIVLIGRFSLSFLNACLRQPAAALDKKPLPVAAAAALDEDPLPVAAAAVAAAAAAAAEVSPVPEDLVRMAILNISYMRKLFPESYFNDKSVPVLVMKIKDLMPKDAESGRMIHWMQSVNDALKNKYLKTLLFCVCEAVGGPMIEEYAFSFSYPNSEITPNQMRSSACKIGVLIHLIGSLDEMPEERTILMKLLYCDDCTDENYEPPCFRSCTEEVNPWTKNPLKMKVSNVNSKHLDLVFDLEVKSVLYGSAVIRGVDVSLGAETQSSLPEASRESSAHVMENGRTNGNGDNCSEFDAAMSSESSSQSKRSRKASAVEEPILQKAQVA